MNAAHSDADSPVAESQAPVERVLFVHAHPDDESISTGGTIAELRSRGAEAHVLTLTRGERGEVTHERFAHLLETPGALAAHREGELAKAVEALDVTAHLYLGQPGARRDGLEPRVYEDSGMRWLADGRAGPLDTLAPETLTAADPNEVAIDVASAIATVDPTAVVSYDADGGYGHPDHELAHRVSALASDVLGVPFYVIVPASAPDASVVVDARPHAATKKAALAAHESQLTIDGDDMVLSGGQRHPIAFVEAFRRHRFDPAPRSPWEHAGLGGRALMLALFGVVGVVLGTVTTLTHQWRLIVFSQWVWVGVGVALAAIALVLLGMRLMYSSRLPALATAIGAYAAISVLALVGPGGDVVVPANEPGWWWVFGSAIVPALIIAWPRLAPRAVA